jgi:hypothetical protein
MNRKRIPGLNIATICSATSEMVQRFSRTQNKKHGPTINDFRLDFTGSGLASAWNKHAAVLFSEHFLSLNKYSCRDEDLIRKAFMTHLIQLKVQYKNFVNGQEKDAESLEREMQNARVARRRNVSI